MTERVFYQKNLSYLQLFLCPARIIGRKASPESLMNWLRRVSGIEALVQAALQEITQNYREASLSNVARSYGVSLAYVSECVRAQTGKTYKELLQKHRMETAARLLRRSDLNIQQIITQVGYENTSYFYRLFHERYGQSPREYRRARSQRT